MRSKNLKFEVLVKNLKGGYLPPFSPLVKALTPGKGQIFAEANCMKIGGGSLHIEEGRHGSTRSTSCLTQSMIH